MTTVFKPTSSDWYGTFQLSKPHRSMRNLCMVIFSKTGPNPPIDGAWHVTVCGNDDYSVSKFFESENEAWQCFVQVIGMDDVTIEALQGLVFDFD